MPDVSSPAQLPAETGADAAAPHIVMSVTANPDLSNSVVVTGTVPHDGPHNVMITWTNPGDASDSIKSVTLDGSDDFSLFVEGLSPGNHTFSVCTVDATSSSVLRSPYETVNVPDPPPAPVGFALDPDSDTGTLPADGVTKVSSPVFTLRAAPNASIISVSTADGSPVLGTTTQGGTDTSADDGLVLYTFTPSSLADGTYKLFATATVAGQTSAASAALTVTVDTAAPVVAITGAVTGSASTIVLGGTVDATGADAATTTIAIYSGAEPPPAGTDMPPVATAVVNSDGTWTATPIAAGAGASSFRAVAVDRAGNEGSSPAFTVTPASTPSTPALSVVPASTIDPGPTPVPHPTPALPLPATPAATPAMSVPAAAPAIPAAPGGHASTVTVAPSVTTPTNNRITAAAAPRLAFDPAVSVEDSDRVGFSGTASAPSGIANVEMFEGDTDLGPATLDPATGAWSFDYTSGPGRHTGLVALATAHDGTATSAWSGYDLTTGVRGEPYTIIQDSYDPDDGAFLGQTFFKAHGAVYVTTAYTGNTDGSITTFYSAGRYFDDKSYYAYSETSDQAGTLLQDTYYNNDGTQDIHGYTPDLLLRSVGCVADGCGPDRFIPTGGGNTFAFTRGSGHDTIASFVVGGPDHDTIGLPAASRGRLDAILGGATDADGAVTLHLNRTDSITIDGVTAAQLQAHARDVTF